ncbi:hypothetical protein QM480_18460 [Flectobacillus sp. DC10W]|uniref:Uncharacterized protein n=1 Tax=Flectobacillus longus TaxID=2984207 RepID=A0ABT6YRW0_9BACT|nr:hypothetical protein [Flectobacillus longus]MDI9866329.1 hypothetical protein [Flectobacillus longus]
MALCIETITYNSNFSGAIYGGNADGQVQIPNDILEGIDQEVDDEAMLALAMLWASEQSGVNPNSFNFDINPFARANFYNSYLSTGVSNEEAGSLVTSVGASTALAYAVKIDGFTIGTKKGYGAQQRFDFHTISSKGLSGKWVPLVLASKPALAYYKDSNTSFFNTPPSH